MALSMDRAHPGDSRIGMTKGEVISEWMGTWEARVSWHGSSPRALGSEHLGTAWTFYDHAASCVMQRMGGPVSQQNKQYQQSPCGSPSFRRTIVPSPASSYAEPVVQGAHSSYYARRGTESIDPLGFRRSQRYLPDPGPLRHER